MMTSCSDYYILRYSEPHVSVGRELFPDIKVTSLGIQARDKNVWRNMWADTQRRLALQIHIENVIYYTINNSRAVSFIQLLGGKWI